MWRRLIESHYLRVMKARNPLLSCCPFNMEGPCLITVDRDMWVALNIYSIYLLFFSLSLNFFVLSWKFHRNIPAIVRRSTFQFIVWSFFQQRCSILKWLLFKDIPFLITKLLISYFA